MSPVSLGGLGNRPPSGMCANQYGVQGWSSSFDCRSRSPEQGVEVQRG